MTITRTSFSLIRFAIVLTFIGFTFIAHAQELTPQERFKQMQADTMEKREAFEANQQEKKADFEAKRPEFQAQTAERKEALREKAEDRKVEFGELSAERQAELKEKMEIRKEEVTEKRDGRKTALKARTQERIKNLSANVSNRMEATIARIRQIVGRFQDRVHTLSKKGVDVSSTQRALDESSAHLDKASLLIGNIDHLVADVIASESPREAWSTAKAQYTEIKEQIKAAHVSLRKALTLLKEAVAQTQRGVSSAVSEGSIEEEAKKTADSEPEV